jgi:hypothetical protein
MREPSVQYTDPALVCAKIDFFGCYSECNMSGVNDNDASEEFVLQALPDFAS